MIYRYDFGIGISLLQQGILMFQKCNNLNILVWYLTMHGSEEFQDHYEHKDYPKLEFTNYEKGVQQLDRSLEN